MIHDLCAALDEGHAAFPCNMHADEAFISSSLPHLLLSLLVNVSLVGEQINFGTLALHGQVVAVLAPEALGALTMTEELAHNRLGVNT